MSSWDERFAGLPESEQGFAGQPEHEQPHGGLCASVLAYYPTLDEINALEQQALDSFMERMGL